MARQLTFKEGSMFFNNPITYTIDALDLSSKSDISFHRVMLEVEIDGVTYPLSQSVAKESTNTTVEFDISSAFRSAAEANVYTAVTSVKTYPVYEAKLIAYDAWIQDGVLNDRQSVAPVVTYHAIAGGFSDYERIVSGGRLTYSASRKPRRGEIAYIGDKVVYGDIVIDNENATITPSSKVVDTSGITEGDIVSGPANDIVVVNPSVEERRNSAMMQFVNSRGIVESIRTCQLAKEDFSSESETINIARPETFSAFGRRVLRKTASTLSMTYSSGFVNYEWARWWMDEFCMSNHHWLLTKDNIWLPVMVKIDDKATLLDATKRELNYVQFTVTPDIHGAMW